MHPTSADLILYGTLATLLVVVVLMSLWGIRSRAALEDEGLTLTAAGVRQRVGSQLLGPGFVWGVWQKLLSSTELRLVLRDETDALVTEVAFFHVPLDGVRHRFTWDGREILGIGAGVRSGRSLLLDAASGAVLLSSDNGTFRVTVYRGDSDDAMFTIRRGFVGGKPTRIEENDKETGVLLSLDQTSSYPPVLTMSHRDFPVLAQVFVYLCVH